MTFELLSAAPFFNNSPAINKARYTQIAKGEVGSAFSSGKVVVSLNDNGTTCELREGDVLPAFLGIQNF